ncbi:MAG TPA: ABC transporter permease, partial [Vicinamibacterales bacterium]
MLRELLSDVTYRLRALVRRSAMDADLVAELRFHIEQQAEEFERRGLPRDEALRQARLTFGGLEATKDATRDAHGTSLIESVLQDLRYALRIIRREPGFSLVVVLILGLGIGANVSTFTVMNALLLRPLPVPHPEQLVIVGDPDSVGSSWHGSPETKYVSYPVFQDVRDRNHVLTGLYASGQLSSPDVFVREPGSTGAIEHPSLRTVSGNFFEVLGVSACVGRTLTPEDDRMGAAAPVAVVSNGYWQRRFGGDRAAIGREFVVNGVPLTIVGVTPASFPGDIVGKTIDAWVPIAIEPVLQPKSTTLDDRSWSWLQMMGRLAPGVSLARARSELAAIEADSIRQHATGDNLTEFEHDLKQEPIGVASGVRGFSKYRTAFGPALTILMAAVVLVVLIVCANVANLMLVRGVARGREMTVRLTLGAGRGRLVRQLFTESVVLAAGGGLLGLFAAQTGSRFLVSIAGTQETAIPLDVSMDLPVLAFTAAITLLAALLFGFAPAARATRVDIATTLRAQARNLLGTRARLGRFPVGKALVIVQIALSAVLLIGAGLLLRSMQRIFAADLGFDRDRLVVIDVASQRSGYEDARRLALMRDLTERVRGVPFVMGVSATMDGLFSGGWSGM